MGIGRFHSVFVHSDGFDILLMCLGFLGAIGDGLSEPVVIFVLSKLRNNIGDASISGTHNLFQTVNQNTKVLCYVALGQCVACFLEAYCWTRTGERQASRLRSRYLKAILRQEVGYFDLQVTSTVDVIASVSTDTQLIQEVISEKVPSFLMNISLFLSSYIMAFVLVWRLAIVGFPFVLLLLIPALIYGRVLRGISKIMKAEYNKAEMKVEQAVSSIRTVYAFVGEAKTMSNYSVALQGTVRLGQRQGLAKGLVIGSNGIIYAIWSFLAYYGSRLVIYHGAKGGSVFGVGYAIILGGLSLGSSLSNIRCFTEASTAAERILKVIEQVPEIDSENMEGHILEKVVGEVEFKNVKFAYPSRPETVIFTDFNLRIPSGLTVALVGESGSGKSTAVVLLQRFYNPIGGEICLDGIAINKLQLKWLRSQMGFVSQEPALFATSIKENILFGKEDAAMEEVISAAKASNAHDFISELPQGYDTQVGERGVQISGGQKQRIAIARALIKAPSILLLDEATSALDTKSERVVEEALNSAIVGRTTIIIAHCLSTIQNANLIAVIQNGQVAEIGSNDELIHDKNGLYASLVRHQQTGNNREEIRSDASTLSNNLQTGSNDNNNGILSIGSLSIPANTSGLNQGPVDDSSTVIRNQDFPVPSFRRLLAMNLPEWKQATMGCIGAVLVGAIQPLFGLAMGSMTFVYFLPDHDEIKHKTMIYSLLGFGLAILFPLTNVIQHYNFAYVGEQLTRRIRERMLSKILTFEVGWFDRDENATGAVCFQLGNDANVARSLVGDRVALLVQTFSAVTVAWTLGLIIAWRLAVVIIVVQPLVVLCFYCKRVLLKGMSKQAIKAQSESSKLAAEAVSNVRTITAFCSQARVLQIFEKAQEGPKSKSIKQSWLAGIGLGITQCLTRCITALAFWYGGKLVSQGYIGAKAMFETFLILVSTGQVIANAGTRTNDLSKGQEAVKSVFSVLDRYSGIDPNDPIGYKPNKVSGDVELCNVQFAYPSRPDTLIFNGFSIKISAGKSMALVGESGSGKSTIIGLIMRFYDPLKGIVKIDHCDIKSYHLRSLRSYIALVSQEPTLFATSIRENIIYGIAHKIDESEVIEAAKAANAHDFITSLEDGYDTWCGDKGLQLSGGQKQRIAIARAIVKNPAILLLDEATSALDSQSERVVQAALERVMVGRTSVIVAHRLSTIRNCDMIAVLDKGKMVEMGTHVSLLDKSPTGAYFSMVSLQRGPEMRPAISSD